MLQKYTHFSARKLLQNIHLSSNNFGPTKSSYWTVSNFSDTWPPGKLVHDVFYLPVVEALYRKN